MKPDRCLTLARSSICNERTNEREILPCKALIKAVGDERGALSWVDAGPEGDGYIVGVILDGAPLLYCPWCGQGLQNLQKVAPETHPHPLFDHETKENSQK